MSKQVITRKASDNPYLHKDFHGVISNGIEYLESRFGEQAVRDYLREFALAFYEPLREALRSRGLVALKEHFERIYLAEGAAVSIRLYADELVLDVPRCPAVTYMREHGYRVARLFLETTRTVNEAICEGTAYAAQLVEYDERDGRSIQRFCRRKP